MKVRLTVTVEGELDDANYLEGENPINVEMNELLSGNISLDEFISTMQTSEPDISLGEITDDD